jgi:hypothetical protein
LRCIEEIVRFEAREKLRLEDMAEAREKKNSEKLSSQKDAKEELQKSKENDSEPPVPADTEGEDSDDEDEEPLGDLEQHCTANNDIWPILTSRLLARCAQPGGEYLRAMLDLLPSGPAPAATEQKKETPFELALLQKGLGRKRLMHIEYDAWRSSSDL